MVYTVHGILQARILEQVAVPFSRDLPNPGIKPKSLHPLQPGSLPLAPLGKPLKVKVTQSCPTLCHPMDYTVHGILQARILEQVAFPFSRGSSHPRDWTQASRIAGRFFTSWATREPKNTGVGIVSLLQGIFLTQESNRGLLHCRWILYHLSHQGSPNIFISNAAHGTVMVSRAAWSLLPFLSYKCGNWEPRISSCQCWLLSIVAQSDFVFLYSVLPSIFSYMSEFFRSLWLAFVVWFGGFR